MLFTSLIMPKTIFFGENDNDVSSALRADIDIAQARRPALGGYPK